MMNAIEIDDQPISATFFGEGKWLSDFITPDEPDIVMLHKQLASGIDKGDAIVSCWDWVANEVKYKNFIQAEIRIEGRTSYQDDFWQSPSVCSKTHVGLC